ncbi:MAG: SUMF1/EgtB/PvdO family nonheme iron enzyme [Myxococcota bacterium]
MTLGLWLASTMAAAAWPDLVMDVPRGQRFANDAAVIVSMSRTSAGITAPYAERDGRAVQQWLRVGRGLPASSVLRVHDGSPVAVDRAVSQALERLGEDGTLFVSIHGQGVLETGEGERLLPSPQWVSQRPLRHAVSVDRLVTALAERDAHRVVVLLDVGFSGHDRTGQLDSGVSRVMTQPMGIRGDRLVVWEGAQSDEAVRDWPELRHGRFTALALSALRGWADGALGEPRDGVVTLGEAQRWVLDVHTSRGLSATPVEDERVDVRGWPMWVGRTEVALAQERWPEDEDAGARFGPENPFEQARRAAVAEVQAGVQEAADEKWAEILRMRARRDPEATVQLRAFVDRFDAVRFPFDEGDLVVQADQITEARRMLRAETLGVDLRMSFVTIQPGEFVMGRQGVGASVLDAAHMVRLTRPVALSAAEVSVEQWRAVMGYTPSGLPASTRPEEPVRHVSWREAVAFCNALSELEGRTPAYRRRGSHMERVPDVDGYRLPTEAEWSLAVHQRWGETLPKGETLCGEGWVGREDDSCPDISPRKTTRVRAVPARQGLWGMIGHVAEWVHDAWRPFGTDRLTDPVSDVGRQRVIRGASWKTPATEVRRGRRDRERAGVSREDVGFRVARPVSYTTP